MQESFDYYRYLGSWYWCTTSFIGYKLWFTKQSWIVHTQVVYHYCTFNIFVIQGRGKNNRTKPAACVILVVWESTTRYILRNVSSVSMPSDIIWDGCREFLRQVFQLLWFEISVWRWNVVFCSVDH